MTLRASLPDLDTLDSAALKTLIFLQHEQLQSKDEQLLRKEEQLASREAEIEQLKLLWAYVRDDRPAGDATPPAVWFAYAPDRKGEHPQAHLRSFRGTLQADAYAGFDPLYETGRIQEAACWAHVRRKFYDLHVAHKSPVAQEALRRIGELYAVEADIRGRQSEERRRVRNQRSRPLLESLKQWLEETLFKLSRKSDTAKRCVMRWAVGKRCCATWTMAG